MYQTTAYLKKPITYVLLLYNNMQLLGTVVIDDCNCKHLKPKTTSNKHQLLEFHGCIYQEVRYVIIYGKGW